MPLGPVGLFGWLVLITIQMLSLCLSGWVALSCSQELFARVCVYVCVHVHVRVHVRVHAILPQEHPDPPLMLPSFMYILQAEASDFPERNVNFWGMWPHSAWNKITFNEVTLKVIYSNNVKLKVIKINMKW